ncbi:M28 family peptidase [Colwellia psychrerythraea]|uniref:Vacuolar membrane protease n=1 Tax=Colwellia psychrerythraea TaxID=28229 RepID=A0A099L315_COLPS|nr:M28 family peptidase [Colwellia psychrerythraea]KGJ97359.1 peptidase M28 [Colwellia psychrerythraea]
MNSPLNFKPLLLTLVVLSFLATFLKTQYTSTIDPVPANAPDTVFSSERAFQYLQQLTKEQVPHPVDSLANRVVEQRIVSLLTELGYQPEIQEATICRDSSRGFARCAKVRNIIVHIQGSSVAKGILLAAHYDSVPAGPGGSDAGAAVGTLLETARLLTLTEPPLNSIVLLFNEGEEFGLFGAQAFMEQHPLAQQLTLAINIEARGSTGKSVMFETGEDSGWLVEQYSKTTPAPLSSSLFYEVYKFLPNDTDLTIFKEHGLQGLNFAHADRLPHYHTPLDNLENLDRGSLQHHGDNVWGVLTQIKDVDLSKVASGNLVYSDIAGLWMVKWSESTSLAWSIALLVVFSALWYLFKVRLQLSAKQQAKGLLACLLVLVSSGLMGYLVLQLVRLFSGHQMPWHANQLPMQLSVWFAVLLCGLVVGRLTVRNLSAVNVVSAVTLLLSVLSLTTSIYLTGVSYLFLIPASMGMVTLLLFRAVTGNELPKELNNTGQQGIVNTVAQPQFSPLKIASLITLALVIAIMFMPIAYVLELMVGYGMSVAIAVVLAFIVIALLPLLTFDSTQSNNLSRLVTVIIAFSASASVVWTSTQATFTSWLPQRLNIQYVQNQHNEAFITTGRTAKILSDSLVSSLGKNNSQPIKNVEVFPWSKRKYQTTAVTSLNKIAPVFTVLSKEFNTNGLQVNAQLITEQVNDENSQLSDVKLYIPVESGLQSIEVGDYSLSYQDDKRSRNGFYEYHCRGISCANITITLNYGEQVNQSLDNQAKSVLVLSAYSGLPQTYSSFISARGDSSVPSQNGDQSIAYKKFEF